MDGNVFSHEKMRTRQVEGVSSSSSSDSADAKNARTAMENMDASTVKVNVQCIGGISEQDDKPGNGAKKVSWTSKKCVGPDSISEGGSL